MLDNVAGFARTETPPVANAAQIEKIPAHVEGSRSISPAVRRFFGSCVAVRGEGVELGLTIISPCLKLCA